MVYEMVDVQSGGEVTLRWRGGGGGGEVASITQCYKRPINSY